MESNEFNQYFTSRGSKCVCVWVYTTHEHYTTRIYLCRYIHTVYVCFYSTGREKLGTLGACLDGIQVRCSSTIRSITDLCRGGGGGQTMCATNRRICAVVTHHGYHEYVYNRRLPRCMCTICRCFLSTAHASTFLKNTPSTRTGQWFPSTIMREEERISDVKNFYWIRWHLLRTNFA